MSGLVGRLFWHRVCYYVPVFFIHQKGDTLCGCSET